MPTTSNISVKIENYALEKFGNNVYQRYVNNANKRFGDVLELSNKRAEAIQKVEKWFSNPSKKDEAEDIAILLGQAITMSEKIIKKETRANKCLTKGLDKGVALIPDKVNQPLVDIVTKMFKIDKNKQIYEDSFNKIYEFIKSSFKNTPSDNFDNLLSKFDNN